ncbi:hypothetical protein ES703_35374 [subsurface metagenome]
MVRAAIKATTLVAAAAPLTATASRPLSPLSFAITSSLLNEPASSPRQAQSCPSLEAQGYPLLLCQVILLAQVLALAQVLVLALAQVLVLALAQVQVQASLPRPQAQP